jgi:hypothetical protein
MLLLHQQAPQESFKLFTNLMLSEPLYNFYTLNLRWVKQFYKVFWKLALDLSPQMHEQFRDTCSGNGFLFQWVTALFSQNLHLTETAYLWDQLLLFGEWELLRVSVALAIAIFTQVKQSHHWHRVLKEFGLVSVK